jgi:hypothetical protein
MKNYLLNLHDQIKIRLSNYLSDEINPIKDFSKSRKFVSFFIYLRNE